MSTERSPGARTISSMSIFRLKHRGCGRSEDDYIETGHPFVTLTRKQPTISRVSDAIKVEGVLEAGRATLRLEIVKSVDCSAQYSCQVRALDGQGKELMQINRLIQNPEGVGNQESGTAMAPGVTLEQLVSLQQQVTLLEASQDGKLEALETRLRDQLEVLDGKFEVVDSRLADLDTGLKDKVKVEKFKDLKRRLAAVEDEMKEFRDKLRYINFGK